MDSRAERAPFLRIFLRCDKFRELASQNSAFPSTATKNLCSAFELNKQPGWRMELNTTAVPLPIFCPCGKVNLTGWVRTMFSNAVRALAARLV